MLQGQKKVYAQINTILCAKGKSFDFPQIEQLQENDKEDYVIIEEAMKVATLLPTGKTVHKTFGLLVSLFADSSSSIKIQSKEVQYLEKINIFIWAEAPMAPRYFSPNWKHFISFSLMENIGVLPEETKFAKFLLDLGDGILNDSNDNIQLPDCCIAPISADIVKGIYGDLIQNKEFNKMTKCAILSAKNADVKEINKRVVELLDMSEERIYTSTENCGDNGDIDEVLLPKYLNTLSSSSLPPYELHLRPNCIIMLIRNLSTNEGLCNGTRLMIIELADHLLKCKILMGDKVGYIVFLNHSILHFK
ncbi:hypothetical protein ACFW04_012937 [Cataglyphis niger]